MVITEPTNTDAAYYFVCSGEGMENDDSSFFVDWADGKPHLARSRQNIQVNLTTNLHLQWF